MTISSNIEADAASRATNVVGPLITLLLAEIRPIINRYSLVEARRAMI
ncbi:hypothetical protein AC519_4370 [Pseudomonas savastanoi]|nr:hypothetical protein AC519_4370 [Pseudomonas savastanoi]